MSTSIYVTPAAGVQVIDPETGKWLPAEGAPVTSSAYWRRRARAGEVLLGAPATKKKASKEER